MRNQLSLPQSTDMRNNIPHFDGIRGLAIFLVATGHIFCEIYCFQIGWVGLNLFFILSGYLITRSLFHYKNYSTHNYFRNFYGRRMLRIFPLYYGVLIFFFLVLPLISRQFHNYYSGLDSMQDSYWFYTSNWNMIRNGLPDQPLFFHFWSLAVEEQFYFIWPLLFLICRSSKSKYIMVSVLLSLSVTSRIITEVPLHAYLSSLTAAEPLLLGCLLSMLQEDGLLGKLIWKLNITAVLSAVFLGIVFVKDQDLHITNEWLMKYGYSAINIVLLAVISSALIGQSWGAATKKFFSAKWLRWLGIYSYSIYVFHWIILKTVVYKIESVLAANAWPELVTYILPRVIGIGLTLIISYCSYHYFEKHFLALKKYFSGDKPWNWSPAGNNIFHKQAKPLRN